MQVRILPGSPIQQEDHEIVIKTKTQKVIDVQDWDQLVSNTYGRPYNFQQQDGCKEWSITVPCAPEDYDRVVNHNKMGVSFRAWLERDPKQPLEGQRYNFQLGLWWARNFYPNVSMVINDLHNRGLLEAGEYVIDIDW